MDAKLLNPDRALIFRVTHLENVPWILEHGLNARSSDRLDPNFISIGSEELIDRRLRREVPVGPGGVLSDYIPFYFTPFSPMLLNIRTGSGVDQRPMGELVMLVSSIPRLLADGIPFVLTDRHAYLQTARYSNGPEGLSAIPWDQLRARDFRRSEEDPSRIERYQAEALVHQRMPLASLLGIACYDESSKRRIEAELTVRGTEMRLIVDPDRFFG